MKKLCCYLGYLPNKNSGTYPEHHFADLSNIFRNNPFPTIELQKVLFHLYPMHEELQNGQLFYFTKIEKSGNIEEIKVEPVDILEYPSLLKGYRLFAKPVLSAHYSNSLLNAVMNRLDEYYDLYVLRELRDKKINTILE
jgi:hypothetical protein